MSHTIPAPFPRDVARSRSKRSPPTSDASFARGLILVADRLHAEVIPRAVRRALPAMNIKIIDRVANAADALATAPIDLFVTELETSEGNVLNLLYQSRDRRPTLKILVVTSQTKSHLLASLQAMAINAVVDSSSAASHDIIQALKAISRGTSYWSPNLLDHLVQDCLSPHSLYKKLRPLDRYVLSLSAEFSSGTVASDKSSLEAAQIANIRRNLRRKLGIRHKGGLLQFALQHGFVRFTPAGLVRAGSDLLDAAIRTEAKRRVTKRPAA